MKGAGFHCIPTWASNLQVQFFYFNFKGRLARKFFAALFCRVKHKEKNSQGHEKMLQS
jgi:hypothetical protein